jgi:LacI family transcriptional regulator
VLLAPASSNGAPVLALQRQKVRVVVLDRCVEGVTVDVVRGDSIGGAYQLVQHLVELGHRQIALLCGPRDLSVSRDRAAGYERALRDANISINPNLQLFGAFTVDSGRAMMQALLMRRPLPTAIFAANNFIAAGALQAMRAAGLRTPEDISVVVFDDLPDPYVTEPMLTVVVQPAYELGRVAAHRLLELIRQAPQSDAQNQNDVQEIILPVHMITRRSTRRIAYANGAES